MVAGCSTPDPMKARRKVKAEGSLAGSQSLIP
jgi:hypothetical protein